MITQTKTIEKIGMDLIAAGLAESKEENGKIFVRITDDGIHAMKLLQNLMEKYK